MKRSPYLRHSPYRKRQRRLVVLDFLAAAIVFVAAAALIGLMLYVTLVLYPST